MIKNICAAASRSMTTGRPKRTGFGACIWGIGTTQMRACGGTESRARRRGAARWWCTISTPTGRVSIAGVLTPVLQRMKMLIKYDSTELEAAIVNAIFGAYIESPYDPQLVEEALGA